MMTTPIIRLLMVEWFCILCLGEDCRHGNKVHRENVATTLLKTSLALYEYIQNFGNIEH